MWNCWSRSREGHKNDQRAGTPLLGGKAERVGTVQPGEEKAPEKTLLQPFSTKRGPVGKMGTGFLARPVVTGQGGMVLN